jgi:hypothetical protein
VRSWEETITVGDDASALSTAVTTTRPAGKAVVVDAQFGKGQVIRTGLPDFSTRLGGGDPDVGNLMEKLWTLLSH